MNLSFVIRSKNNSVSHLTEHLFLVRTKNYPEPYSLLKYLKIKDGVDTVFVTYLDYAEITFYNITKESIEIILEEYKSWYFLEKDFLLEQKVMEIELSHTDHNLDISKLFFKEYTSGVDKDYLLNVSYQSFCNDFKNVNVQEIIFDNDLSQLDTNKIILTESKIRIVDKKNTNGYLIYKLNYSPYLYEILALIKSCIEELIKENILEFDYFILENNTNTVFIKSALPRFLLKILVSIFVYFKFDYAFSKNEKPENKNLLRRLLTKSVLIRKIKTYKEIRKMTSELINLLF